MTGMRSLVKAGFCVFVAGTLGQCAMYDDSYLVQVDISKADIGAEAPSFYSRKGDGNCLCADGTSEPAKTLTVMSDGVVDIEPTCRSFCTAWPKCVGYFAVSMHYNLCWLYYEVGEKSSLERVPGFTGWTDVVIGAPSNRGTGMFYGGRIFDTGCEAATSTGVGYSTGQSSGCQLKDGSLAASTFSDTPPAAPSPAPTPYPSPAPTPSPTNHSSPQGSVSAVGDPHLVNIYGQHFDLLQSGNYTMIHIPKWARAHTTLLRVDAFAERHGGACMDIYIQSLKISGKWVSNHKAGRHGVKGVQYFAKEPIKIDGPRWHKFGGRVSLKVVWGSTRDGVQYLNLLVRNLNHAGTSVGGLLGEDDHTLASRPSAACKHSIDI